MNMVNTMAVEGNQSPQAGRVDRWTQRGAGAGVLPQSGAGDCACGGASSAGATPSYVYALGRIQPRFPTPGIEKEFAQLVGRSDVSGLTDSQAMHAVLSKRANRYLARRMCWVFSVEGLDTYLLTPRDPADLDLLVESLRAGPRPTDVDVVLGVRGGIAPPEACNGLQVPIVAFDAIYSFDVDTLLKSIPRPESIPADKFVAAAEELFLRLMQLADNAGATDDHRALNYLAVRYSAIYAMSAEAFGRNATLASVDVRPSRLGAPRTIVDVIFTFVNRLTDVEEKLFVRVDVTEEFPFLVTKISPYYDR